MPRGIATAGRTVLVLGRNPGDTPILLRLTAEGWVITEAHLQVGGNPVTAANPVPVTGVGPGGAVVVIQPVHDLLNCNANMQVGDADVANPNPVPVSDAGGTLTVDQAIHDNLNLNANIQVGDADVSPANLVPVDVANNVAATFDHGSNSAIGVAATQFIVASIPATLGVEVKAANDNAANVYIGNVDVTAATVDATDGMELGPGESILVRIDNVNKLYGISTLANQRVFWLVV